MVEELFRQDAYLKQADAMVTTVEEKGVRLDRTIFYPTGGGQPGDTGVLRWEGGEAAIVDTILRRMNDYVHYITPQFSRTHINFQRVPTVDTSNPFIARDIPTADESFVVIRFRDPHGVDFPYYLQMIHDSFMSRPNTIVVPGGKMGFAMEVILSPIIHDMIAKKKKK